MAAKKKRAKKKTTKRKIRTARQVFDDKLRGLQKQLPPTAARLVGELRKNVKSLERQIDKARTDAEKLLRRAEAQIRRDAANALRRLEHFIEPRQPKRKKPATRKKR